MGHLAGQCDIVRPTERRFALPESKNAILPRGMPHMPTEKDEWLGRLHALADTMQNKPLDIRLGSPPGPYRLPKCSGVALHIHEPGDSQLLFDTETGQRVLMPISAETLRTLGNLISDALKSP